MSFNKVPSPRIKAIRRFFFAVALSAVVMSLGAVAANAFYQRVKYEKIGPGVKYYHFSDPASPVNIDVLRISRREGLIQVQPTLGDGLLGGTETVSRQAMSTDSDSHYPIAAINGDFFYAGGMPLGVMVVNREIITSPALKSGREPSRPAFVTYGAGQPDVADISYIGDMTAPDGSHCSINSVNRPSSRGAAIYTARYGENTPSDGGQEISLGDITGIEQESRFKLLGGRRYRAKIREVRRAGGSIPPDGAVISLGSGSGCIRSARKGARVYFEFERVGGRAPVVNAIGGWPVIVDEGKNLHEPGRSPRHPRTAIGFSKDEIFFMVVDGRSSESRGMTFYELGELMLRMKCIKGINLDGGGSSAMWVRGNVRNRVSDGKERPVSNAVVVTSTAPKTGRLERLAVEPSELSILTGQTTQLYASGQDRYYNPVSLRAQVEWNADDSIGDVSQNGSFRSAFRPGTGKLRVRSGELIQLIDVNVYNEPPLFQIYPTRINLLEGESIRFRHWAMDHNGLPVIGDYTRVLQWDVTPGLGSIDSSGLFRAGSVAMKGQVTVRLGSVERSAEVKVGTLQKLLEDFEEGFVWRFDSHPDRQVGGSFTLTERASYHGRLGGELKYRFDNRFDTEAVYAKADFDMGRAMGLRVMVKGDGSANQLRLAYRDGNNERKTISFENDGTLGNASWHAAVVKFPPDETLPIRFESIYVLANREDPTPLSGVIYLDDVAALYWP